MNARKLLPHHILIALGNVLFVFLALWLAWANRMAADDYCIAVQAMQRGVLGAVVWWWQHWTGRWLERLVVSTFSLLLIRSGRSFPIDLATLLWITGGTFFLFRAIMNRVLRRTIPLWMALNLTLFLGSV